MLSKKKNTNNPKMAAIPAPLRQPHTAPIEPPPPPGTYPLSDTWHDDNFLMNLLGMGKRGFRYWLKKKYIYYSQVSGHRRRFNDADIQDFLRRCRRCGGS